MTIRAFLAVLFVFVGSAAWGREWVDNTGKYRTEAELIEYRGDQGKVVLKKSDGRQVVVPIERLRAADQQYVKARPDNSTPNNSARIAGENGSLSGATMPAGAAKSPRMYLTAALLARLLPQTAETPPDETPADKTPAAETLPPGDSSAPPTESAELPEQEAEMPALTRPGESAAAKDEAPATETHPAAETVAPADQKQPAMEAVPPPPAPEATADESGRSRLAGRDRRFVYKSRRGNFHLVPDNAGGDAGTALYWWPPHRRGIHLLDSINEDHSATYKLYWVYLASPGAPVRRWAFSKQLWTNGCHHVWYQRPNGQWRFYSYADREKVF